MEISFGTIVSTLILVIACLLVALTYKLLSDRRRRAASVFEMLETRSLAILQSMPYMAWMKDASGRLLFANSTYERYIGKSAGDILGKRTAEIWPPDVAIPTELADKKAVADGVPVATEVAMQVPGVGMRIVHVTRVPVRNKSGQSVGIVGVGEDVTEQKLAEQSKKLTSCVFDGSSEGIIVADRDGRILAANLAIQKITGFTAKELEGTLIEELHPAKNQSEARERLELAIQQGCWTGEATGVRSSGRHYPQRLHLDVVKNEQGVVANFVAIVSDITDQREREDEIIYLARYDQLTGLANRHYFTDWLISASAEARQCESHLAVMFVDIDRFKNVNDRLGHQMGDKLIQAVAERIKDAIPQDCFVARMGGDEFLVGVKQTTARDISTIAEQLHAALTPLYRIDGCDLPISASIGFALYPDDSHIPDQLIMQADMAMHQAKALGRNRIQGFTLELRDRITEFNNFAAQLKAEGITDALAVRYQPKVDMRTGDLVGFEALVRWIHPEQGEILPDRFIDIAEETGSITSIGNVVLATVCRQLHSWGANARPVAINISAVQMKQTDFVEEFVSTIDSFGIRRNLIEIEITESLLIDDKDAAVSKIKELRQQGIRIALDDFGSGYSSLSYLTTLPIDVIKIDRSFVSRLPCVEENDAVIRFLVTLSDRLGLGLIAEGVENSLQAEQLIRTGCAIGQGWLYGRPLLCEDATALLIAHSPPAQACANYATNP